MNRKRSIGFMPKDELEGHRHLLRRYINLQLAAHGVVVEAGDNELQALGGDFLRVYQEKSRLLQDHLCPVDQRIQNFLDNYLSDLSEEVPRPRLPGHTLVLDQHGLARELSLPVDRDDFSDEIIESYRTAQGVLHNPKHDRRTTKGVFHVAEGGLPIPQDKRAVPKQTYAYLLAAALNPPASATRLPYTSTQQDPAHLTISTMLRPVVCPEIPGQSKRKTMEVRFFAPGALVANLDFVESIFGNAGDPYLPENDAGLDAVHWTGHTGCVILAPHLPTLRKKDVGLPHISEASERQQRDGMCWSQEDELYNEGTPFKITARTLDGVMVTIISDNYFGYCKKEVKTQIGFAANCYGLAEEEHAGGAVAYASYNLAEHFQLDSRVPQDGQTFAEISESFAAMMDVQPEGYGIDRTYPEIFYIPEDATVDLPSQKVYWDQDGQERSIRLAPGNVYIYPCGYKVHVEKHPGAPTWRIIGTEAEGTFCHKPCTVSGGGKSEISKSVQDAIIYGPIYVADFKEDMDQVEEIFNRDYSDRLLPKFRHDYSKRSSRPFLSNERTLGSVIKLLTPSPGEFTDEYNAWLESIPNRIRALAYIIKRFYKQDWGDDWRRHFHVDQINGEPGHELKFGDRRLVGSYLRVGMDDDDETWRTYKLRQDFIAAAKTQREDDISASVVVPSDWLDNGHDGVRPSMRLVENCEYRLFQRPDEAVIRGYDKQAEKDMAGPYVFMSNYQPLATDQVREIVDDVAGFDQYTQPMKELFMQAASRDGWAASSSNPRIVDGVPTKNPRYLQNRPDLDDPRHYYVQEVGARLFRRVGPGRSLLKPVDAVLTGRRNNPPDFKAGIRPLAVYNPIHYQELPEVFMDFVCSLTGKSPSTTGAGSEGALTKGPFNALRATADLNNALVSYILTGYSAFSSAAGYVGPNCRVDHDISLLVPEIWCRLPLRDRDPDHLIEEGCLEQIKDFEHDGETIHASRLGYRITSKFVHSYLGKIFDNPATVFDESMLKPETQDFASYVDGIKNITEAMQRVAQYYLDDGSVEEACPPLEALLHIMATGSWNGKDAHDPEFRAMFTRESLLKSDWYRERLNVRQRREIALWQRHVDSLERFLAEAYNAEPAKRLGVRGRLAEAKHELDRVQSDAYLTSLVGTIGADPMAG